MIGIKEITAARNNWKKAAEDFEFKIISPYLLSGTNKEVFAYLPEYGSPNGTIVELISGPEYKIDKHVEKWAIENSFFYSFINIDRVINYNREYFGEILDDWIKNDNSHQ